MKTLYFDCFAGASGNMLLGALVGLGVASDELHSELAKMDVPAFEIVFETRDKSGIAALHADVRVPDEKNHRHLHHIEGIITNSALSDGVKSRAISIFRTLAAAEAKVHGIDISKVHFHEVGALDAIIDIVGCCICFEKLGIESFASSKLHVGSGFVEMAHGKFPVPPPAVAEILRDAPVYSTEITGELVTPTGAAIIATVCKSFGPIPEIRIEKVSYGAGTRDYMNFPNAIRLIVGRSSSGGHLSKLLLIETNVDDITGQTLG
ncbi:MAG TPA: nickel pincer cofactor biosynthesis protein LarC, partial [Pyrinomonadaceae bacterium]|nr:nickel pincer cofactor biosynthesis protein LarC [Pyrinomonadaceae bacterium]